MKNDCEYETIEIDLTADTNDEWKRIIEEKIRKAQYFEVHCWNDEIEEIDMALKFGRIKESSWIYGKKIQGRVTDQFIEYLLSIPKPQDCEVYNKMTPFFSIFLDEVFSSEHYGTELIQKNS